MSTDRLPSLPSQFVTLFDLFPHFRQKIPHRSRDTTLSGWFRLKLLAYRRDPQWSSISALVVTTTRFEFQYDPLPFPFGFFIPVPPTYALVFNIRGDKSPVAEEPC